MTDREMPTDAALERLTTVWNWAVDAAQGSLEHDGMWVIAARHVLQLIQSSPLLTSAVPLPPMRPAYQRMTDEEYAELQYESGMAAD